MKNMLQSLTGPIVLGLIVSGFVACGGGGNSMIPASTIPTATLRGVYEGTLTTAQESGSETSLLIEEDNSFSLVTDSGIQLLGNLTQVNAQVYTGTAVLSLAEDTPALSVSLSLTVNAQRAVSASFMGGAVGSFSVLPSTEATASSISVNLTQLSGSYAAVPRSISTHLATQWTLSSSGTLTGSDAVSSYSGTVTQPRADQNPFAINFTRQLTGPSIPAASFVGRLWYLPARDSRPARMVLASRRVTEGNRGLAGIFAKQ